VKDELDSERAKNRELEEKVKQLEAENETLRRKEEEHDAAMLKQQKVELSA